MAQKAQKGRVAKYGKKTKKKASTQEDLTVPVWVDEFRKLGKHTMARMTYLAVEADDPIAGYPLPLESGTSPVMTTGLSAALCQPSAKKNRFESAQDIQDLFDSIEEEHEYFVETPDLWLPTAVLEARGRKPQRGDVFRISREHLSAGLRMRAGQISPQTLVAECKKIRRKGVYSAGETKAFAEWNQLQVAEAQKQYAGFKKKNITLDWYDRDAKRVFKPKG